MKGKILHFLSRKAMNVLAGEATVEQLYNKQWVRTPADLYSLTEYQLLQLEGWKERSARRLLQSLADSRNVPFERVLFALGIRYVGETTAREVARHFGSIDALKNASREELLSVADVGEVIADSVFAYFRNDDNLQEISRLQAAGLQFSTDGGQGRLSHALDGKTIVISGNFSISRDAMKALIEAHGGKNSSSVSGKTSYLLADSKPGPEKVKKATELAVEIIDEAALREMIGDSSASLGMTGSSSFGMTGSSPLGMTDAEPTLF